MEQERANFPDLVLHTRHLKGGNRTVIANDGGSPTQGRKLGVGACGRGSSGQSGWAASRALGKFNPGHAPHHLGIRVTPPGLGREKLWGDLGGWCAPRDGVAPHSGPQLAPRGSGEKCFRFFPAGVPALSRGVGGLKLANRHFAGTARMPHSRHFAGMAGPVASKQAKNRLRGRSPGARPARSLDRFPPRPIPAARPAQMRRSGGAIVMAIGASSPAWIPVDGLDRGRPGRAERGRGMAARRGSPQSGRTVGGGSVSRADLDPAA